MLEEFILSNNLHILNDNKVIRTFESNTGSSNVDLTITNNRMLPLMFDWECLNEGNCSDHRTIKFNVGYKRNKTNQYNFTGTRYICSDKDYKHFESNFVNEIKRTLQLDGHIWDTDFLDTQLAALVLREADIDSVVQKFENSITTACKLSFRTCKTPTKNVRNKSVPWWTQELLIMRKKTNALRRRYQRTKNDEQLREQRKQQYMEGKRIYMSLLSENQNSSHGKITAI